MRNSHTVMQAHLCEANAGEDVLELALRCFAVVCCCSVVRAISMADASSSYMSVCEQTERVGKLYCALSKLQGLHRT